MPRVKAAPRDDTFNKWQNWDLNPNSTPILSYSPHCLGFKNLGSFLQGSIETWKGLETSLLNLQTESTTLALSTSQKVHKHAHLELERAINLAKKINYRVFQAMFSPLLFLLIKGTGEMSSGKSPKQGDKSWKVDPISASQSFGVWWFVGWHLPAKRLMVKEVHGEYFIWGFPKWIFCWAFCNIMQQNDFRLN